MANLGATMLLVGVSRLGELTVYEFFQLRAIFISSFSFNSGGDNLRNAIREEDDGLWRHSKLEEPIQQWSSTIIGGYDGKLSTGTAPSTLATSNFG